jgi:hypothetical protein
VKILIVCGLMVVTASLAGCAGHLAYPSGPFRGRVIDAETKQPLAGAAVVVVWWWDAPGLGHPTEGVEDAVEVVTDKDGEFIVPRKSHVRFFGEVTRYYIVVYFPGYRDFLGQHGFDVSDSSCGTPKVVELARAGDSERRRFARIPLAASDVEKNKIPNLMRLVEQEERALGLDR